MTRDRRGRQGSTATGSRTGDSSGAGPAARRREFLTAWAAPAAATAMAGCAGLGDGGTPLVEDREPGDVTSFGGAMRFGEAYAMTVTATATGETTLTARFDGSNRYLRYDEDGTTVESFLVDGEGYTVVDGDCTRYPDLDAGRRAVESVAEPEGATVSTQVAVTGRTEVEGRSVVVFEPDESASTADTDVGSSATYYVDEASRYPSRIETAASVVEYRDWNAVAAVEPPDGDCRSADTG